MTIQGTIAVPYILMRGYLNGDYNRIASIASKYDRVWMISITAPGDIYAPPLVEHDEEDRIGLLFNDSNGRDIGLTHFDNAMAKQVCEFLVKADAYDPESSDLVVVNCYMGVSRSGAVSTFIREAFQLDYEQWRQENSHVSPNYFVLDKLHHQWMKMEFEKE